MLMRSLELSHIWDMKILKQGHKYKVKIYPLRIKKENGGLHVQFNSTLT